MQSKLPGLCPRLFGVAEVGLGLGLAPCKDSFLCSQHPHQDRRLSVLLCFGRSSEPDFLGHVAGERQGQTQVLRNPHAQSLSRVLLFVTPWTVACQTPLSMGFSRQECWSVWPFPPPGDLPYAGIEPRGSPVASALSGEFFTTAPFKSTPLCHLFCFPVTFNLI